MRSSHALLLLIGLILGLAGGLVYSWIINPVEYTDTAPASLRQDFKEDYLGLVALAYAASGDLNRTRARLAVLGSSASIEELSRLAQSRLAAGRPESEAQALAQLASVLGERPIVSIASATSSPEGAVRQPTQTPSVSPSPTRRPSPTASSTPGAPFALIEQESICDPTLSEPLLQIVVQDAAGNGIPAVQILVVWDEGQDRFFTGLKPELGAGYADFAMESGTIYSLQLMDGESPVSGLTAEQCTDPTGDPFLGSWMLIFQQPGTE